MRSFLIWLFSIALGVSAYIESDMSPNPQILSRRNANDNLLERRGFLGKKKGKPESKEPPAPRWSANLPHDLDNFTSQGANQQGIPQPPATASPQQRPNPLTSSSARHPQTGPGQYPIRSHIGLKPVPNLGTGGPVWMDAERTRLADYKNSAATSKYIYSPQDQRRITATTAEMAAESEPLKVAAKNARRVNKQNAGDFKALLASDLKAQDPIIMNARQKTFDVTGKVASAQQALAEGEGSTAVTANHFGEFHTAVKHVQGSNRAYQRGFVHQAYTNGLERKFHVKLNRENVLKAADQGPAAQAAAAEKLKAAEDKYKQHAERYDKEYKNTRIVQQEFDGSSSDESEKSTFNDILGSSRRSVTHPR